MTLTNIILAILFGAGILISLYWALVNHRRHKLNLLVADELDGLIKSTLKLVQANKETAARSPTIKATIKNLYDPTHPSVGKVLEDPGMLAALLTVAVAKYGNLRLGMTDFAQLSDDDFISVYIDTKQDELILSLDHELTLKDLSPSLVDFGKKSDDNTFH